jgi:hypothetical protein
MIGRITAMFAAWALTFATPAAAQPAPALFASAEPIHLVIQAPLPALMRNRAARTAVAGTLTEPSGQSLPISLQLRGITRRTAEICDFAPLRVDFVSPPAATSLFAGQKRLKLVTHCRNAASFQQYLLLEYAAYKMYNLLSPRSFRVRLANIDYRDADGRAILSRAGFFIEDLRDVARRNGLAQVHAGARIPVNFLSNADAGRYGMFQHMIANHDWSMRAGPAGDDCCHNAPLIGAAAPGQAIPVPYDFDYSGFVAAPYALPPEELHLSDVRQRLYRGYCFQNAEALGAARQMRNTRPQLIAAIAQTPGLAEPTQRKAIAFLDKFFADIGTDADVAAKVLNRCVR